MDVLKNFCISLLVGLICASGAASQNPVVGVPPPAQAPRPPSATTTKDQNLEIRSTGPIPTRTTSIHGPPGSTTISPSTEFSIPAAGGGPSPKTTVTGSTITTTRSPTSSATTDGATVKAMDQPIQPRPPASGVIGIPSPATTPKTLESTRSTTPKEVGPQATGATGPLPSASPVTARPGTTTAAGAGQSGGESGKKNITGPVVGAPAPVQSPDGETLLGPDGSPIPQTTTTNSTPRPTNRPTTTASIRPTTTTTIPTTTTTITRPTTTTPTPTTTTTIRPTTTATLLIRTATLR